MNKLCIPFAALCALALVFAPAARSQTPRTLSVTADSQRWDLQGQATVTQYLGIVTSENDAVYLPLNRGSNELMPALDELGGGCGFICRLAHLED